MYHLSTESCPKIGRKRALHRTKTSPETKCGRSPETPSMVPMLGRKSPSRTLRPDGVRIGHTTDARAVVCCIIRRANCH